ncbi:hypothetical protein [Anaeromyxobacter sp. SG64]|uniref:hypothetical protein n=1 Tax=Anaeromyxobacter sp. SG64 TaxID=2925409 RepID=UPI001F587AD6|nr:hypothetical protein [Anaeromyxobacter sp. SG64]
MSLPRSLPSLLVVFGPLFLLGFGAGALRALASRPGTNDRRRRALQAAWVLLLLGGTPLWLFLAAALGLF